MVQCGLCLRWYWAGEFPETTGTGGKVLGPDAGAGCSNASREGRDKHLRLVDGCWWLLMVRGRNFGLNSVTRCYTCYIATESEMIKLCKDNRCLSEVLEVFLAEMGSWGNIWPHWDSEARLKNKYIIYRSYYRKDLQSKWKFKNCDLTPGGIARKGPSFTLLHASALCFCHWGSTGVCSAMLLRGA